MQPSLIAGVFLAVAGNVAFSQAGPAADSSTQIRKTWEPGRPGMDDPEKKDGSIDDALILGFLQQLAAKLVSAAGVPPVRIRLTRSTNQYASLLPNRTLYISAGLLDRIEDEAELAGLMAHELAHVAQGQGSACVLAPNLTPPGNGDVRDRERQATVRAIPYLKAAGYDPISLLAMLSKLAYEHPEWARRIDPEDLVDLRVPLEAETIPAAGYRLDSSAFVQVRRSLETILGTVIQSNSATSQLRRSFRR